MYLAYYWCYGAWRESGNHSSLSPRGFSELGKSFSTICSSIFAPSLKTVVDSRRSMSGRGVEKSGARGPIRKRLLVLISRQRTAGVQI